MAAKLGRPIESPLLEQAEKDWDLTRRRALLAPPESAIGALVALRSAGLKIGVLSNTHASELRAWPESPLAGLVDVLVLSHEIGAMKPALATYEAVLSRLGAPASVCVYVGDGSNDELVGPASLSSFSHRSFRCYRLKLTSPLSPLVTYLSCCRSYSTELVGRSRA